VDYRSITAGASLGPPFSRVVEDRSVGHPVRLVRNSYNGPNGVREITPLMSASSSSRSSIGCLGGQLSR